MEESPSPSRRGSLDSPTWLVRRKKSQKYLLVQALLCVLCTATWALWGPTSLHLQVVGAFYPTLLDLSKTASEHELFANGHEDRHTRRRFSGALRRSERRIPSAQPPWSW